MKALKDFFYDKNDIFLAILILAVAALLITWRMRAIMAYPQTLIAEAEAGASQTTVTEPAAAPQPSDATADDSNAGSAEEADGLWADGALTRTVTVTVEGGDATTAVQSLIDADLFASYDEFSQVCANAGCRPEDIKATTFVFDPGATQTDIAVTVTE